MIHLSEQQLDLYFLTPQSLGIEDRKYIDDHIGECLLCKERFETLQAFYQEVDSELEQPPGEQDKVLADRLGAKPHLALPSTALQKVEAAIDAYVEVIEPIKRSLMQRFVHYTKQNPVYVGGGVLAMFALAFSLVWFVPRKDTNPDYARAEKEFLVVYNKEGQELWRKHIGVGYDWEKLKTFYNNIDDFLTTIDVDGDGKKEIICSFGSTGVDSLANIICCFKADGGERWKYVLHRDMTFGNQQLPDNYEFRYMYTYRHKENGNIDVIAAATHRTHFPSVVLRFGGATGSFLGEYWNSGIFIKFLCRDINGDGIEELLCGGHNNGFRQAMLTVLDPMCIDGQAPAPPEYQAKILNPGTEKYYLLFPRTDLQEIANRRENVFTNLDSTLNKLIRIVISEHVDTYYPVFYYFNNSIQCVKVDETDIYRLFHDKMVAEGKLTKKLDTQYYEDLRKRVLYWDGNKFVNYPTMNERYLKTIGKSQ